MKKSALKKLHGQHDHHGGAGGRHGLISVCESVREPRGRRTTAVAGGGGSVVWWPLLAFSSWAVVLSTVCESPRLVLAARLQLAREDIFRRRHRSQPPWDNWAKAAAMQLLLHAHFRWRKPARQSFASLTASTFFQQAYLDSQSSSRIVCKRR